MGKDSITVTLPLMAPALRAQAQAFNALADSLHAAGIPRLEDSPVDEPTTTPPPPAANTPSEKAEPTAPPASEGVELDSQGLPWDARIHSSGRTKYKTGNVGAWVTKRGVSAAEIEKVEAELRAIMDAPAGATVDEPEETPPPPPPSTAPEAGDSVPPPPPTSEPLSAPEDFMSLVRAVTAEGFTNEELQDGASAIGLPSFHALAQRPDLISQYWNQLKQ